MGTNYLKEFFCQTVHVIRQCTKSCRNLKQLRMKYVIIDYPTEEDRSNKMSIWVLRCNI